MNTKSVSLLKSLERIEASVKENKRYLDSTKKYKKVVVKKTKQNPNCIFPCCKNQSTYINGKFCLDHKSVDVRHKFIKSEGYSTQEANFYSKVANFEKFISILNNLKLH